MGLEGGMLCLLGLILKIRVIRPTISTSFHAEILLRHSLEAPQGNA